MNRLAAVVAVLLLAACGQEKGPAETVVADKNEGVTQDFHVQVDRFADIKILRYNVPGFDGLSLQEKKLAYYLSQAALSGHDIIYDQNYEHNLRIRKLLSAIVVSYGGDRDSEEFVALHSYAKQVWFANGIHHHYSSDKMLPGFAPEALERMTKQSDAALLPLEDGQTVDDLLSLLEARRGPRRPRLLSGSCVPWLGPGERSTRERSAAPAG